MSKECVEDNFFNWGIPVMFYVINICMQNYKIIELYSHTQLSIY